MEQKAKKPTKPLLIAAAALVAIIVAVLIITMPSSGNKPTISKAEFDRITTGMTYEEVVEIIGSKGEVLSDTDLGFGSEYRTAIYMWEGEGQTGANANITFQGGKVISKAQMWLK